jgi:hypothetical protein
MACASQGSDRPTGWQGFGGGRLPGADWRPYAPRSPFNEPIPADVRVVGNSRAIVDRMLSWAPPVTLVAGSGGTTDDYGHPTYYARSSDPVFRLRPAVPWGGATVRGRRIHIPDAAKAAPGADGHMTVVEPDGWEYDFWQVKSKPRGGGTMTFSLGSRQRIDGNGLRGRATAAGFGNLAGIIRAPELAAGKIDHALFLVVRCATTSTGFGFGARRRREDSAYVYPAAAGGASCPDDPSAPPLGARIQLAMTSAQIDALHLPVWKRGLVLALARYGGYIGDTGGPGVGIQMESSLSYTALGQRDPLVALGAEQARARLGAVRSYGGRYFFDIADGVDWARYLRVVAPPAR